MTSANPRLGVKCFICDKPSTLECELADGKASPARAQRWGCPHCDAVNSVDLPGRIVSITID